MTKKSAIEEQIKNKLNPHFLNVVDESSMHKHTGASETHFRIEIVSDSFHNKKLLERHRLLNELLRSELSGVKAFSLHTFTFEEWEKKNKSFERSPTCNSHKL